MIRIRFHQVISFSLSLLPCVPCAASAGTKLLPVLNHPITDRSGVPGAPISVNLNTAFGTEAIDNQVVRFTSHFTDNNVALVLEMALFSNRTPVTRNNFLKYVTDGDYNNSLIHRSMPNFVIQGGGFQLNNQNQIVPIPTDAPIVNEFGVSNTLGTVSMAKLGGDPNSATSQWFVSLGANSDNLDNQNGGFTVFGRVTKSTLETAQLFGDETVFPTYNYSNTLGTAFTDLPLYPPNYLILFPTVTLEPLPAGQAGEDPTLSYSIVGNSNPSAVTATVLPGGELQVTPQTGLVGASSTITVRATDSVGNTVDDTFVVTINENYNSWALRTEFFSAQSGINQDPDGDGFNNLHEFAFLGNPSSSSQTEMPVAGKSGSLPASQFLILTFPVRKFTTGLTYTVQGANSPSGPWNEIWTSSMGFTHAQVLAAVSQSDRTTVTVKDLFAVSTTGSRFLRVKVTQE